ncbi:DinB family protein [Ichthyenterobacterium sp. W332]|uniref:DinB family protein n=1 Tax=Microcosmobacter mediterraneus TaxID=3075607 RepID=A0ABU2YGW4_9FLAO|nr:DinB family protein [Ichthyenterobacterium sp. W332]MDT0557424.1 DinB family protein [Ichthyenterobacterium sp. W332]
MDKEAIVELLEEKHQDLFKVLDSKNPEQWTSGPKGKWTTGQHALHLLQSIKPLNTALSMPKFLLKYKFGKANRPVRAYDAVVKRYQDRLIEAKGKTFKGSQNMKLPSFNDKSYILTRLQVEQKKLQVKTQRLKDKDLDHLILPHPLLGKMPVREIIMWTAYHVQHHTKTLMENYD